MSVLGSQVFGQALMDSCEEELGHLSKDTVLLNQLILLFGIFPGFVCPSSSLAHTSRAFQYRPITQLLGQYFDLLKKTLKKTKVRFLLLKKTEKKMRYGSYSKNRQQNGPRKGFWNQGKVLVKVKKNGLKHIKTGKTNKFTLKIELLGNFFTFINRP